MKYIFIISIFLVWYNQPKLSLQTNYLKPGTKLSAILNVDSISEIAIQNTWTEKNTILSGPKLAAFINTVRNAKSMPVMLKPGHLYMDIKFKSGQGIIKTHAYMYSGSIYFDPGVDKQGKEFSAGFAVPAQINWDRL